MTHLGDKLKRLAEGTTGFTKQLEAKVDAALAEHEAKQQDINARVDKTFATVEAIHADAAAGIAAVEAELKDVTNH